MWHKAVEADETQRSTIIYREIEGKEILIINCDGKLYGCGAICPHQGTNMKDGLVFDDELTCTEHSWVFSLKTGELTYPGNGPRIPVYPVRITDGIVEVDIE
jgi:3-phenylpropionate/trans-cinnamate dioxygenase ferredoxin subunit